MSLRNDLVITAVLLLQRPRFITPVPGGQMPSSDSHWYWACMWHAYTYVGRTLIHKINVKATITKSFILCGFW